MIARKPKTEAEPTAEDFPLSPTEAGKLARMSSRQLIRYASKGMVAHYLMARGVRKDYRFRESDINDFIERQQQKGEFRPVTPVDEKRPETPSDQDHADEANPEVEHVKRSHPKLFRHWKPRDWEELYSTFGHGGALTEEAVIARANHINGTRAIRRKIEVILKSDQAETLALVVDGLYRKALNK